VIMKTNKYLVLLFSLLVIFVSYAQQAGDLDNAFGNSGIVLVDIENLDDVSYSSLVQPDGKIVLGGTSVDGTIRYMSLTRLNQDGSLDLSFSGDGKLTIPLTGDPENGEKVLLQGDKIIIAGYSEEAYYPKNFVMYRFNSDGSADVSFGNGGRVETEFSGNNLEDAVYTAVIAGDKIILAGETYESAVNSNFALARYNFDGSLDNTFGNGGRVFTDFATLQFDRIYDLAIQSDGKIIAVGESAPEYPFPWNWAIARYNVDGTLDNTFGTNGKVIQYWAGLYDGLDAIALLPDGKFLVAGTAEEITRVVARYNVDGALDDTFGDAGKTQIPGVNPSIIVYGNKIFAATSLYGMNAFDFIISRLNYDGGLDNTFGNGGSLSTTISADDDAARDINIQFDGKILLAGNSGFPGDYAAVRYLNDPLQVNIPFYIVDDLWNQGFINFSDLGDPGVTAVDAVVYSDSTPVGPFNDSFVAFGVANRFYEITVTPQSAGSNSSYNASLRLYYSDSDIQGINESNLKLVRLTNDGWIYIGGTVNTNENYVEANNVHDVGIFAFADPDSITNVNSNENGLVNDFKLEQNYPNPFNPSTKIKYSIPQSEFVSLKVFDILGNEVATLANEERTAGNYEVNLNAINLSSGIYFYKLQTGNFVESKKMILIK
ncbi:MAG: T9SS type A sorting domain-containing protein, partial [Ignavibacteriaceae bacterium]|nr:T9SS type A sorting domain-containing protein [Ignavibacteriaceae bacterium]